MAQARLFLLALGKFTLEGHVLQDDPNPAFSNWACMDCVVKSWLYGAIFPELSDMAPRSCSTAVSPLGVAGREITVLGEPGDGRPLPQL